MITMRRRLPHFAMIGLMAFLWLAQAFHCDTREVPGLNFLGCNSSNAENEAHSCCGGTCKVVEATQGGVLERKRLSEPHPELPPWFTASFLEPEADHGNVLADVPPEFPKRWQFLVRTALPVRAPSVIS